MIRHASEADAAALTQIINRAFVVERFFIDSDRIALAETLDRLRNGVFLVGEEAGENGAEIAACVYVELRGERGYFGLLSVDPARQRSGWGKRLIAAAEDFCRKEGCRFMDILVVNLRTELPPVYSRLGYAESARSEFPPGVETKLPCHFIQMTKAL